MTTPPLPGASLDIDFTGTAHATWRDADGRLLYARGTPTGGGTAYTWSPPVRVRRRPLRALWRRALQRWTLR